jgi:hypothetical protein
MDNLNTHRKNDEWLACHPLVTFHYTPTRASWLNQVEGWFSILGPVADRRHVQLGRAAQGPTSMLSSRPTTTMPSRSCGPSPRSISAASKAGVPATYDSGYYAVPARCERRPAVAPVLGRGCDHRPILVSQSDMEGIRDWPSASLGPAGLRDRDNTLEPAIVTCAALAPVLTADLGEGGIRRRPALRQRRVGGERNTLDTRPGGRRSARPLCPRRSASSAG